MDVGEDPQETVARGRTGWERIDMEQVVPGAELDGSTLLLVRAEAGVVDLPVAGVAREECRHEVDRPARIVAHDRVRPAPGVVAGPLDSLETVFHGTIA